MQTDGLRHSHTENVRLRRTYTCAYIRGLVKKISASTRKMTRAEDSCYDNTSTS